MSQPEFRSGFACFVGRPNAGKSTLTNALVGTKVVITSSRPQTTRTVVRGIVHRPDAQLILVDTPGLHRPRTLLGERLNDLVMATWSEVDVVAVIRGTAALEGIAISATTISEGDHTLEVVVDPLRWIQIVDYDALAAMPPPPPGEPLVIAEGSTAYNALALAMTGAPPQIILHE